MNQRGFTLIELLIAFTIIGIIILGAIPVLMGSSNPTNNISWGVNGMTESRCIEGYKFVVGERGQARQILDEFGKGVKCEQPSMPKF